MILSHKCVLPLLGNLNGDDAESGWLRISYFGDNGLYKATAEQLPDLIRAESHSVKNQNKQASVHTRIVYSSAKRFLNR